MLPVTLPPSATAVQQPGEPNKKWGPTHAAFADQHGNRFEWRSRGHRKGRYPLLVDTRHIQTGHLAPRLAPIWFGYPFSDISYWVAFVFTLGCVAWVINGHYALYSSGAAVAASEQQALFVTAIAAMFGGTLFEIGSWLLYWEALNQEPQVHTGKQVLPRKQNSARQAQGQATGGQQQQQQQVQLGQQSSKQQQQQPSSQHDTNLQPDVEPGLVVCSSTGSTLDEAGVHFLSPVANERHSSLIRRRQQQQRQEPAEQQQQAQQKHLQEAAEKGQMQQQAVAAPLKTKSHQQQQQQVHKHSQFSGDYRISASTAGTTAAAAATSPPGQPHIASSKGFGEGVAAASAHDAAAGMGSGGRQQWRWLGYKRHDLGFMSSFLQLIGATIFWVPCIFGTPGVFVAEDSTNYAVWNGVYWLLQVVGACFFVLSSIGFMLEEQKAWYKPAPLRIGWQVGFWNLIGALGFLLSGAFGFLAEPHARLQVGGTAASTFWGSYAFLVGSYLQLLEAVNKHPDSLRWREQPCLTFLMGRR